MNKQEMKEIEKELERREAIALNLADQLNEKIDECEALKEKVDILKKLLRTAAFGELTPNPFTAEGVQ